MPLKLMLTGLEFALDNTRLRVGRADHLDISIHGDPLISSNHCIVDNAVLVDAASTNGTSINGTKIKHEVRAQLKHGDVITLGETSLYVVEGVPYDGVQPTAADGRPIEVSTKGGTGKLPKKKEAGGSKAASSLARAKQKAGHERVDSSSSAAASAASSTAPSPSSSTTYRPAPTAPASPTSVIPITSTVAASAFNFTDQSRPLPAGASAFATATSTSSGSQRSSRSSSFTDRSRLLDMSHASLDDSMNAEGLLDLSAPVGGRAQAEGVMGGVDVDDSAMMVRWTTRMKTASTSVWTAAAARAILDPAYTVSTCSPT